MSQPVIGAPRSRVDGPDKVRGVAKYTCDRTLDGMLHAVVVPSAIATGRIVAIDTEAARKATGVILVMTHQNAPKVNEKKPGPRIRCCICSRATSWSSTGNPSRSSSPGRLSRRSTPPISCASLDVHAPQMNLDTGEAFTPKSMLGDPPTSHARGGGPTRTRGRASQVSNIYRTPTEHHNPMETHGTVATWDGDQLTLYDSTQWAFGVRNRLGNVFAIGPKQVRVIAPFVGGAFGSKGTAWSHVPIAAMAAKVTGRPVKLLVTRPQMFGWVGHRPQTERNVSAGADADGTLVAMLHDVRNETSMSDEFIEPCATFSRDLYAVPHYTMRQELRRLSISKPTYQRAPGESTGGFAVESAMDELAYELGIDPAGVTPPQLFSSQS